MIISSSIMKDSQVGDSSCLKKLKVSPWAKGNFCNKGTLYTLMRSGLYRLYNCVKTRNVQWAGIPFSSKEILETNIKLWLIGMLKNLEGILSEIHKSKMDWWSKWGCIHMQ